MGDTIKEFFIFISDNPLMLGLCIAIVLLFLILIIVLFAGGKRNKKEKDVLENTSELFTTTIDNQKLKSTNELKTVDENITFSEEDNNLEEDLEFNEEDAPININEALNLKKEREAIPSIENTSTATFAKFDKTEVVPIPVELNKNPVKKLEINMENTGMSKINRDEIRSNGTNPVLNKESNEAEFNDISSHKPIIPDSINDDNEIDKSINNLLDEVNQLKTNQISFDENPSKPIEFKNEFAQIKPKEVELPKQSLNFVKNNTTEFSKTDVINQIPDLTDLDEDENLDDIELPKFKVDDTSPIKHIKGESFNIN